MQKQIIEKLFANKNYSRQQIYKMMLNENPTLSRNSFNWIINSMIKEQILARQQRGLYSLALNDTNRKKTYCPVFNEIAIRLLQNLEERFPLVEFICFESVHLNEFLNHLIAQDTYFIMADRDALESIFRHLQKSGFKNLLFKPNMKEWDLYWTSESVVLLNRISETPKNKVVLHGMSIEQLLVDIIAEKTMQMLYSKNEIQRIYNKANASYKIDNAKLIRYARRRGKVEEVKKYIEVI